MPLSKQIDAEDDLRALLSTDTLHPTVVVWIDPESEPCAHYRKTFEREASSRDDLIGAVVDVTKAGTLYEQYEYAVVPMTRAFWRGQPGREAAGDLGEGFLRDYLDDVVAKAQAVASQMPGGE